MPPVLIWKFTPPRFPLRRTSSGPEQEVALPAPRRQSRQRGTVPPAGLRGVGAEAHHVLQDELAVLLAAVELFVIVLQPDAPEFAVGPVDHHPEGEGVVADLGVAGRRKPGVPGADPPARRRLVDPLNVPAARDRVGLKLLEMLFPFALLRQRIDVRLPGARNTRPGGSPRFPVRCRSEPGRSGSRGRKAASFR